MRDAICLAARDVQIASSFLHFIAREKLKLQFYQLCFGKIMLDFYFTKTAEKPLEMCIAINKFSIFKKRNFVNTVSKLKTSIFDVDESLVVRDELAVEVGDARHWI